MDIVLHDGPAATFLRPREDMTGQVSRSSCKRRQTSGGNHSMDITIRDAVEADLPGILDIYNDAVANTTAI